MTDSLPDAKAAGVVLWSKNGEFLVGYQPQKNANGLSRAASVYQASLVSKELLTFCVAKFPMRRGAELMRLDWMPSSG